MGTQARHSPLLQNNAPDLVSLLGREARGVASKMRGSGAEVTVAPLRQLEHWCERYLSLTSEPSEQFAMFFLSSFIHDIFFNLTGDLPYDEDTEARKREYFSELAQQFNQLGAAIEEDRTRDLSALFHAMVAHYVRAIGLMNQATPGNERTSDGTDAKPTNQP